MIIFTIALRNVVKHWRQSIASIISISAAFLTLTVFQGYLYDVRGLFETIYARRMMFGDVIVEHKELYSIAGRSEPWKYNLDLQTQKFLNQLIDDQGDKVENHVRFLKMPGMISNGRTTVIFAGYGYVRGPQGNGQVEVWRSKCGDARAQLRAGPRQVGSDDVQGNRRRLVHAHREEVPHRLEGNPRPHFKVKAVRCDRGTMILGCRRSF